MTEMTPKPAGNFSGRLTAKAGPLPVYGWAILIGVGGLAFYKFYWSKRSSATTAATDTTATDNTLTDADIAAGVIGADYDLRNTLGVTNSNVATLASNVSANTGAIKANTKEEQDENPQSHNYAVVAYGNHEYELGTTGGASITKAEQAKAKVHAPEKGAKYVQLKWAPKNFFELGQSVPRHLTEEEFKKIKGHPKATVVVTNTHTNLAPSKVRP